MKLKFTEDKFYNGECIFQAGKVYEVSEDKGWSGRWIKRGGIPVTEETKIVVPIEEKKEEIKISQVVENKKEETIEVIQPKIETSSKKKNKKPTSEEIL